MPKNFRLEFPTEPIDGRAWHSHGEYDAGRPFGLHGGTEHPHDGVGHLIDIYASEGIERPMRLRDLRVTS